MKKAARIDIHAPFYDKLGRIKQKIGESKVLITRARYGCFFLPSYTLCLS